MKTLYMVNFIISIVFTICYLYQFIFIPIVWLFRKKVQFPEAPFKNRYAVLICARNESLVISDLIGSLRAQSYDQSKLSIFVLADNCTDDTKDVALKAGADRVYVRYNKEKIGKGYALDELLGHLKEDYPDGFDGYFVFDADNILKKDYIEKMNRTFSAGYDIITSYRNTKNYGDSWISAGNALWYLRDSRYLNQARMILNTSCAVYGTGFMFSQKIVDELGGWPFHLLIEDTEFTVNQITTANRKVAFCHEAEFYDEQPVSFSQSWRQRMRWCRGYLQVFSAYIGKLLKGILHGNFSCYDMLMSFAPAYLLSTVTVVLNLVLITLAVIQGATILEALRSTGMLILGAYVAAFILGMITTISEWKHIQHTSSFKKILYCFTFPLFTFTYVPISIASYFCKVGWKPIIHTRSLSAMGRESEAAGLPDSDSSESEAASKEKE